MITRIALALALTIATVAPGFADQAPTAPPAHKKGFIFIPLIVGAIIGAHWFNNHGQKCYKQVVLHDENGKPIVKTICETSDGPIVVD